MSKKKSLKFRSENLLGKVNKSFLVWTGCILVFFVVVFIGTSGFKEEVVKYDKILGISEILGIPIGIAILVGIVSFLIFFISSIKFLIEKQNLKKKHFLIKVLRMVLIIALLPLFLAKEVIKQTQLFKRIKNKDLKSLKEKFILKDLGFAILIIVFLIPLWGSAYYILGYIPASMTGLVSEPIPIAGTGSMYPTFPKGHSKDPKKLAEELVATAGMKPYPNGLKISNINLFGHEIERGDIIVAENEKIRERGKKIYGEPSGIVKRVIALPGDKILIKDGLVYLNGKTLKEPYIARSRSTFGGEFLRDCNELKIPEGKLFIMGDNRKGSGDSRHDTGLIDYKDVQYVLPYKDQLGNLDRGWHDPKDDDKESARITLNVDKYLELINKQRAKAGLKPLRYEKKLEFSARLRGDNILKYDDFSYEATRSGYTQIKAMNAAGYSNIVWNEGILQGNYEVEELIEYLSEFPDWKKNLLEVKDYQDFGISEVQGTLNGCPSQVIVQHFAGYIPPNYKKEDIDSWGKLINDLNNVIPNWEKAREYKGINQDDLNKIIGLMYQRKNNAEAIYYRMKANQWLTKQEEQMIDNDKVLYDEIESLAKKIND